MEIRRNSQAQPPSQKVLALSVDATSSGTTTVKAPASGRALRLYYYSLSADPENTAKVKAGLRWTAAGANFAAANLSQYGGVFAHSYKNGDSYVQGGVDEALVVNLSAAQLVTVNIDYEEINP